MSDPMDDIRASFFLECEDLIEGLFDALQDMSDGAADGETINVAFRAVHSIKGGAGAFALDDLVSFAHHFETALDNVRSNRVALDAPLVGLLFRCGDVLSDIVGATRDGGVFDEAAVESVVALLATYGPDLSADSAPDTVEFHPVALDLDGIDLGALDNAPPDNADLAGPTRLRVVFKPEPELYLSGNEPLFLLRSLEDLGPCSTSLQVLPPVDGDAERIPGGHLQWTVDIETDAPPHEVEERFEFVQGLCYLSIQRLVAEQEPEAPHPPITGDPPPARETWPATAHCAPIARTSGAPGEAPAASPRASHNATVRVDLIRIDRLVNLVGEGCRERT